MDDIIKNYVELSFDGDQPVEFKYHQFVNNYVPYFPTDKKAFVIDIGIGRGEMLSLMKEKFDNYLGLDISPSTIQLCKKRGLNCQIVENTNQFLLEAQGTIDLITMLDVLEHFKKEDIIPFLKTAYQGLKVGGKLIIQVPNLQAPDGQLHRYNDFTHEVGFLQHSLRQVLLAGGFKKIEFKGYEDIYLPDFKFKVRKFLRTLFWKYVRLTRRINGNLNPEILHPVLFVVVEK